MGAVNIHGQEFPILKIFSDDFFFEVPLYQRPYAWTTEQAEELFDDLLTFAVDNTEQIEDLTPYFLGSIVLIKGEGPNAEIVDGQQRLTTLAILLSAIRALVPSIHADELTFLLYQEEKLIAGIPARYRLSIRERDNEFFREYIQRKNGLDKLKTLDAVTLSDSQKNIRDNALLLIERLTPLPVYQRIRLAQAIVTRCYLVVVSTPNFDSAYRIFSVLNDRGLNLSHADILKADFIGKISPGEGRAKYNESWEETEELLGRERFQNLFGHIRMIYRKAKPRGTVLGEFREHVWPTQNPQRAMKPIEFIDNVLLPYAEAYATIRAVNYQSTRLADKLNGLFAWLNRIDNADWIPPAILYYARNYKNPHDMLRFFIDLERLAAGLMILRANVNKRIERYGRLLDALEKNEDVYAVTSPLQLTAKERASILTVLDGNLYEYGFCKYVLLRLDEALADSGVTYDYTVISVEHVLPQHPGSNSLWMTTFPSVEEREKYVHRLGNLVLLTQKKNSKAANKDFIEKRDTYFRMATGVTKFVLTSGVILEAEWTPAIIERRQQVLLNRLKDIWRLN